MTPAQAIYTHILAGVAIEEWEEAGIDVPPRIPPEEAEALYNELNKHVHLGDSLEELRCSGVQTHVKGGPWGRHYECEEVGARLSCGRWVGWTYWHGGGKHGEPEGIPWIEEAYFLDVEESEEWVMVRKFERS